MTTTTSRVLAAAALTALALTPTGCSQPAPPAAPAAPAPPAVPIPTAPPTPPAPPPMPPPDPSTVDRNSPDAVAQAVVGLNYVIDTNQIRGWTDAARRARPLLTPDFAGRLATTPSPAPDAQWSTWTAHHAYTSVQSHPSADEHPPDQLATAARAVEITTTPYGRDGWRGEPEHYEVFVTLARTDQGWSASSLLAR